MNCVTSALQVPALDEVEIAKAETKVCAAVGGLVASVQHVWRRSPKVAFEYCEAVRSNLRTEPSRQWLGTDAVTCVLEAMAAWPNHVGVQTSGAFALELCIRLRESLDIMLRFGVINVLCAAGRR